MAEESPRLWVEVYESNEPDDPIMRWSIFLSTIEGQPVATGWSDGEEEARSITNRQIAIIAKALGIGEMVMISSEEIEIPEKKDAN